MVSISLRFADSLRHFAVDIARLEEGEGRKILRLLNSLLDDIAFQLEGSTVGQGVATATNLRRAEVLIKQVDRTIATYYPEARRQLGNILVDLGQMTQLRGASILNGGLELDVVSPVFTRGDLRELITDQMVRGAPSKDWWAKQSKGLRDRFTAELRIGILEGQTNQQLVQRIRGKATGRRIRVTDVQGRSRVVRQFKGGIMDTSTREASALVRTSVQTTSNNVLYETYKGARDVIKGVQALVTLDLRTTDICISRSGGAWDFDDEPLENSPVQEPFPGPPPWHWQCRTILIPITYSWEELAERGGKSQRIQDRLDPGQRASMDGTLAGDLDYPEWLSTRSIAEQNQVLGRGRAQLFRDGDLSLRELLDQSGRPLTLAQINARNN